MLDYILEGMDNPRLPCTGFAADISEMLLAFFFLEHRTVIVKKRCRQEQFRGVGPVYRLLIIE